MILEAILSWDLLVQGVVFPEIEEKICVDSGLVSENVIDASVSWSLGKDFYRTVQARPQSWFCGQHEKAYK